VTTVGGWAQLASGPMFDTTLSASAGALAAVGIVLLGACGGDGSETIDVARLEEDIATDLAEDVDQPTPEVECPDDLEPSEGEQFECTGTAQDGAEFTIEVTWTDDEGGADAYVPPEQFG
jgi:Domain of unknown function (DUF4333)